MGHIQSLQGVLIFALKLQPGIQQFFPQPIISSPKFRFF